MSYLFQVSLGPVQGFIVGARRTRDLKFGSLFLSELAEVVVKSLVGQYGRESLIFPALGQDSSLEDVPNKILAYLDDASESDITTLAATLKGAINKRIDGIKEKVFHSIEKNLSPSQAERQWPDLLAHRESLLKEIRERFSETAGHEGVAIRQIRDLVEYSWVAIPYQKKDADYAIRRQQLEGLLAARKNTRDFAPVTWGEELTQREPRGVPKSSIDGMLESVVPETAYPQRLNTRNPQGLEDRKWDYLRKVRILREAFGAGPHEKLSAIDLLKRLGPVSNSGDDFPSTSHVAALPFLYGLLKLDTTKYAQAAGGLDAYIQELLEIKEILPAFTPDLLPKAYRNQPLKDILGKYDGSLLYPERFPDMVGDTQGFELAREQFKAATRTLEDLLNEIDLHPQPYYAILVADGDSMGKVIDALARRSDGLQQHQALSLALSGMVEKVRETMSKHAGIRIYSGGDDILAMLPLHTAIQCVSELARQFRDNLKDFINGEGKSPTLSGGLAIVHHLHPLGDALSIARDAEKRAKKGEKNALAITLQKRSGPPCEIGGAWDTFDTRLERLVELCEEIIPSGMAYELRELALRLNPDPDPEEKKDAASASDQKAMSVSSQEKKTSTSPDYIQYAALRVLQRKMGETSAARQDKKAAALALYALKCMIGLIGANGERPEDALKALYKTLDPQAKDPQLLIELEQKVEPMNKLQPVRVEDLANELVVARFFADARRLANGGVAPEGASI